MVNDNIVKCLIEMGITSYEAKVFVTLTKLGSATVGEIYPRANVPRSAVYGALEKLEQRGVIEKSVGRPRVFRALPPKLAIEKLESSFYRAREEAMKKLEKIYLSSSGIREGGDTIWVIKGGREVKERIEILIKNATKKIIIGGQLSQIVEFRELLEDAKKRKVKIQILTFEKDVRSCLKRLGGHMVLPIKEEIPAKLGIRLLIVDDKLALFGSKYLTDKGLQQEYAFWSNSLTFVSFLKFSVSQTIETAKYSHTVE